MPPDQSPLSPTAVISNGFSKFEVAYSAEEAHDAGRLDGYLTGLYPTAFWRRLLRKLGARRGSGRVRAGIARFLDRATRLPDACVTSFALPEILYLVALALPASWKSRNDLLGRLIVRSFRMYGRRAARAVARASPRAAIYHYRSGFGGASLRAARKRKMVLLCEHSIADPRAVDFLVQNGGRLPTPSQAGPMTRFWRYVADDLAQSDFVVTNSDFVKKTMVAMGHPADSIFTLYRGVDDNFIAMLDSGAVPQRQRADGPLRLLYAGSFGRRKGAECVGAAMELLKDTQGWTLALAGPVEDECRPTYDRLAGDPRVRALGQLSRQDLAVAMRQADVFIFPTLAEGSARVVFEALAAGCFVITTENSGSIVGKDGQGALIEPESPQALAAAITALIGDPARVAAGGDRNSAIIRSDYRQSAYGNKLMALYDKIAAHDARA